MKILITESQFKRLIENIIISEIFSDLNISKNEIQNVKILKDNENEIVITFSTNIDNYVLEGVIDNFDSKVGKTTIKTIQQYNENKPVYKVRFGIYKNGKIDARTITNYNEIYLILKVVFNYLKKYIDKYDIRIIYFISEGEQKIRLYQYIINEHFKNFYFFNEKDRLIGNISFMIKKEDYDRSTNKK